MRNIEQKIIFTALSLGFAASLAHAEVRSRRPNILGVQLGMDLEVAKVRGRKLAKSGPCVLSAVDLYGLAKLSCGSAVEMTLAKDASGRLTVAALSLTGGMRGAVFDRQWRDLVKRNGPPCADDRSTDGAVFYLWGFQEDGTKVKEDVPGCYPSSREILETEVDGESFDFLQCGPKERGDYFAVNDSTHYYRNDDDLGWSLRAVSCGLMADSIARRSLHESLE